MEGEKITIGRKIKGTWWQEICIWLCGHKKTKYAFFIFLAIVFTATLSIYESLILSLIIVTIWFLGIYLLLETSIDKNVIRIIDCRGNKSYTLIIKADPTGRVLEAVTIQEALIRDGNSYCLVDLGNLDEEGRLDKRYQFEGGLPCALDEEISVCFDITLSVFAKAEFDLQEIYDKIGQHFIGDVINFINNDFRLYLSKCREEINAQLAKCQGDTRQFDIIANALSLLKKFQPDISNMFVDKIIIKQSTINFYPDTKS